jgi:phosphoglycolate phosphatase
VADAAQEARPGNRLARHDSPELVLFDLDGTLVDSVKDLAGAAGQMMHTLGRAPPAVERVRRYVGNGIERLVHRCLTDDMNADAPEHEFDCAIELFMAFYEQHNARHSTVYAGVIEGLEATAGIVAHMGCVTNKSQRFTQPLLAALALHRYFELVVCGDTTAHKKPHPAPLLYAMEKFALTPAQVMFVGDSANDVQAARAARMSVVCVDYGYNHGHDIADSEPDAVLSTLADLPALLG